MSTSKLLKKTSVIRHGRLFPGRMKMNINVITIVAILAAAICSFGLLEYMMLAYWKEMGSTKDVSDGKPDKRQLDFGRKPGLSCFGACMERFGWDVDETSLCAAKCRA